MNPEKPKQENELEIVAYPDMSKMSEETLQKLAAKEREWFGYGMEGRGFGEYAICSDPECRRVLSVEDVYPEVSETTDKYTPLADLEKDGINLPCCPDCNGQMEALLDPEYFPEYLRIYFSQKVYGALLMEGDEVKGAVSAFTAPFEEAFEGNINYRNSYDIDEVLEKISKITGKTPDEIREQIFACCNRVALDPSVRKKGLLSKLIQKGLNQHSEFDNYPSLGDVKLYGPIYPIMKALQYKKILEDDYNNALFFSDRFGNFRDGFNLTGEEFKTKFKKTLNRTKIEQQKQQQEEGLRPMNVKNVPLLREIFVKDSDSSLDLVQGKKVENVKPNIEIEAFTSEELTEETLKEFTEFFRYMFNNSYGGQYLVYPSVGEPISPSEVFDRDGFISLDELDSFDPLSFPKHPETSENAVFWHHPNFTLNTFAKKTKKNAHFSIIRNLDTRKIEGIMFGHKCTIKELFETEEWENPLLYSGFKIPENLRDFQEFISKLNKELSFNGLDELTPETEVYGWNCIATHPNVRGLENLTKLTKAFFEKIPQEMKEELLIVGETKYQSRAHALFKTGGGIDIKGILTESDEIEEGDPIIIIGPLSYASKIFSLSKKEFEEMMKSC